MSVPEAWGERTPARVDPPPDDSRADCRLASARARSITASLTERARRGDTGRRTLHSTRTRLANTGPFAPATTVPPVTRHERRGRCLLDRLDARGVLTVQSLTEQVASRVPGAPIGGDAS